jgi:hypothetical protein
MIENTIKIVSGAPQSNVELEGQKLEIGGRAWTVPLTNLKFTGSSETFKMIDINNEERNPPIDAKLLSITQKTNFKIEVGDYTTGKFWEQSENNYLVASYSPEKKNDYGYLRIIRHEPLTGKYQIKDNFFFAYPFNKVSALNIDEKTTIIMIGYNGVVGPSQQMLIMQDSKFSTPKRSRDIFDNRRLTLIKGKGTKNVLAFHQKFDSIYLQPGTFTKGTGDINDWKLEFDSTVESQIEVAKGINTFWFVDSEDKITFYYNKKIDQSKFMFIRTYDKATN